MIEFRRNLSCIFTGFILSFGVVPSSQIDAGAAAADEAERANMSPRMQAAIQLYEEGRDTDALDRFMDILVQGEPSERPIANEYLNLITQRMNGGPVDSASTRSAAMPSVPTPSNVSAPIRPSRNAVEPAPRGFRAAAGVSEPLPARSGSRSAFQNPTADEPIAPAPQPRRSAFSQPAPAALESQPRRSAYSEPAPANPKPQEPVMDKEAMKKEIGAALHAKARYYLDVVQRTNSVRVVMGDGIHPRAIGVPSSSLFSSGVVFKREASGLLKGLTGLVFSLGGAQVSLLPEGSIAGDAKIMDMRRAMGVSAQLYSAGISPSRVKVNLLQSQNDIPKELSGYRGLVFLFSYNQPENLASERVVGEEAGPPISLGAFPDAFHAEKNEGAIIEFSVMESPAKLASWKFLLLRPGHELGGDLSPLQEVSGTSPVFHQIYWNGRKGFFGENLQPGRYQAVLSATDARNRTRTLHAWITLIGASGAPEMEPSDNRSVAVELPHPAPRKKAVHAAKNKKKSQKKLAKRKLHLKSEDPSASAATSAQTPVEPPSGPAPAGGRVNRGGFPVASNDSESNTAGASRDNSGRGGSEAGGAVSYKIGFGVNSQDMTQEGEKRLAQVVDTQTFYPMEKLNLVGYASSDEANAAALALNRARLVMSRLTDRYHIDPSRLRISSKVVPTPSHEVEIYIVSGGKD